MELQIVGTNTKVGPSVRRHIQSKLGKLNRHSPNIMETKVEVSEEKTKSPQQHYLVRATVSSDGAVFHGEERGEDLFATIDRVAEIMVRQVEHHKGKKYEKGRGVSLARGIPAAAAPAESRATPEDKRIVRTKRFLIHPMTESEAIDQMEILEHDFFLFLDAGEKKLKVLYRRKDGNYGLIEPEIG